ncbi:MAG: sigma-70 family RNA polymerase sigma factor [Planctomycetota bacterium]
MSAAPLDRSAEDRLWERYVGTRSRSDRDLLVEFYIPYYATVLRAKIYKMQVPSEADRDAAVQEGLVALLDCVERFEPAKGHRFKTFATSRVIGAMLDELRRQDWVPRTTRSHEKRRVAIESGDGDARAEMGERAWRDSFSPPPPVSIDKPRAFADGREVSFKDTVAAPADDRRGLEELWDRLTCGLDAQSRRIVDLYCRNGLTMGRIGQVIGVSESRVSQIFTGLKRRMRQVETGIHVRGGPSPPPDRSRRTRRGPTPRPRPVIPFPIPDAPAPRRQTAMDRIESLKVESRAAARRSAWLASFVDCLDEAFKIDPTGKLFSETVEKVTGCVSVRKEFPDSLKSRPTVARRRRPVTEVDADRAKLLAELKSGGRTTRELAAATGVAANSVWGILKNDPRVSHVTGDSGAVFSLVERAEGVA